MDQHVVLYTISSSIHDTAMVIEASASTRQCWTMDPQVEVNSRTHVMELVARVRKLHAAHQNPVHLARASCEKCVAN
jgi:hypothetical protein